MAFPLFRYLPGQEPPFSILIAHRDTQRAGYWRPEALIGLTKSLRLSGFLLALPPEDLKCFLVLLSFVSANGHCTASLGQIAEVLHLSTGKTRERVKRLEAFRWFEQPVIFSHRAGSGLETYTLIPGFLPVIEETLQPPTRPALKTLPREVVIERSRRKYARPRAEVEAEIALLNGWKLPDETTIPTETEPAEPLDPHKAAAQRELLRAGLLPEQADELLTRFDLVRIERQLMWLPYRNVRKPAGFLLAAIKDDYAAPLNWRPAIPQEKMENEMFDRGPEKEDDAP